MPYIHLENLRLTENEKAVLAALRKFTAAKNVSKIAREAHVPRTTTEYILRKFQKLRIARKVRWKRRYHWRYDKIIDAPKIRLDYVGTSD